MSILLNTSPAALAIEGTLPDTLAEVECSVGRIGDTVRDTSVVIRATLITLLPDTPVAEIDSYESDGIVEPPIVIGTGAATSALTFPDGSDSVHSDWYCTPAQPRPPQIPCSGLQSEEACAVLGGLHCRWHQTRQECEELARGGTIQLATDPDLPPLPRTARPRAVRPHAASVLKFPSSTCLPRLMALRWRCLSKHREKGRRRTQEEGQKRKKRNDAVWLDFRRSGTEFDELAAQVMPACEALGSYSYIANAIYINAR